MESSESCSGSVEVDTMGISYDVSPDGRRLLVVKRAETNVRNKLHIVTNWFAGLPNKARSVRLFANTVRYEEAKI